MVSQDSPPNPNSCAQFGNQDFALYPSHFDTISPSNFMDLLGPSHHPHKLQLFPSPHHCPSQPSLVARSKYWSPARSLLEEVASVGGHATDLNNEMYMRRLSRMGKNGSLRLRSSLRLDFPTNDLEAKIMKLITMLEEVERRYEQYCHQMEELVSSFEAISGKSYTSLALEAMSKHFCSLRDAIISQINAIRRKPAEEEAAPWLSSLSLFHNPRLQNLSLQQLGMAQNSRQSWRPIRGLPETSVATLRAWLFQHFLHPYPNDSEKQMLASQTGLTKSQISNWFINARVRLWKPMIEEMYKEEFAESCSADESDPMFGVTHSVDE